MACADRRTLQRWAIAVIVVAAAARVGWAAWIAHAEPSAVYNPDTPGYIWPARALIDGGRFSFSPTDPTPMYLRTPGYPAFLAAILWPTGSAWAISPIQATVSLLGVAVIVLVAWRLLGPTAALVAGAVVALDPLQFAASGALLTESVASVVLVAIVAVGVVVFASRRPRDVPLAVLLALGALVAVATLVRPAFWFYPLVLLVLLAVRFRRLPWRSVVARLLVFLLPVAVGVGGWQLRNHVAVDSWQVSGASGLAMHCWYAADVEAQVSGISVDDARRQLGCPQFDANPDGVCTPTVGCQVPDPDAKGQGFDAWGRQGLDILADHPVQAARTMVEGAVREVGGPGDAFVSRYLDTDESWPLTAALFSWNAALWVFAAGGALVGLRSKHRGFWVFVIATIGYVMVASAGVGADARYRIPVIPLLVLLAALGVQRSLRSLRRSRAQASGDHGEHLVAVGD